MMLEQLAILDKILYSDLLKVENEKTVCDVIEHCFRQFKLAYKREQNLIYQVTKPDKRWRHYWADGSFYDLIRADFLIDDAVIEVKYREQDGKNKNVHRNSYIPQCSSYLNVAGVNAVYLLLYQNYKSKAVFEIFSLDTVKRKYKLTKQALIIIVPETKEMRFYYTAREPLEYRLGPILEYCDKRARENLDKLRKEYKEAGYV